MSAPLVIDVAAVKAVDDLTLVFIPSASGARLELSAELRAQAIVQTALDKARDKQRAHIGESLVEAFERADRRVAIEVERGVFEARTAVAVLHELAESLAKRAPQLRERLIPNLTEGACRALAQR